MQCPVCSNLIEESDKKFLWGVDKPYMSVYLHRECYKSIPNKLEYLSQNAEKLYNYFVAQVKTKK